MPTTAQKRYYSVKDAAKLIGVSTNTIYTYLRSGQLKYRRIGKGRIKISPESVLPYTQNLLPQQAAENNSSQIEENIPLLNSLPVVSMSNRQNLSVPTIEPQEIETNGDQTLEASGKELEKLPSISVENLDIIPNRNDIFFFRIFKAISLLGLAVIYFLTAKNIFNISLLFSKETTEVLTFTLPYLLLGAGIFNILEVLSPKLFQNYHFAVDIITVMVFAYYGVMAINSGDLGRIIYISSFVVVALSHLIQFPHLEVRHTFFDGYVKFTLAFSLLAGIVISYSPRILPFKLLGGLVSSNLNIAGVIWFVFIVFPLVYFISGFNTSPKNASGYFVFRALLAFITGTQFLVTSNWDLAYLTFLIAIFDLFMAWWQVYGTSISLDKSYIMVLIFSWIGATILIGNISIRYFHNSFIEDKKSELSIKLGQVGANINAQISQNSSVLTFYSGQESLKLILNNKEEELAISLAKEIYDKSKFPRRVVVTDSQGVALGVYPRDSLTQGANLSSRTYFQKTKETYKSYFSPVYNDLAGEATVIQTEPVFADNNFIGMIGVSPDLEAMSSVYEGLLGKDINFYVSDVEGLLAVSSDITQIGSKLPKSLASESLIDESLVDSSSHISSVGWDLYASTYSQPILGNISSSNIYLTTILIINSFVSLAIGMSLVSKRNSTKPVKFTNTAKQVSLNFN